MRDESIENEMIKEADVNQQKLKIDNETAK